MSTHWSAAALLLAATAWAAPAAQPAGWPAINPPEGARITTVAPDILVNGQHSRLVQLDLDGTLQQAQRHFARQFGPRHVVNQLGDATLVATQRGGYFLTAKLAASAGGRVQATLITTAVASQPQYSPAWDATRRLLPPESTVALSTESSDGPARALTLTAVNRHDVAANLDHLAAGLRAQGYQTQRRELTQAQGRPAASLWLQGDQGSATVTVVDLGAQRAVTIQRSDNPSPNQP